MGLFFFLSSFTDPIMRKIYATKSIKWEEGVEDVSIKARTVTVKGTRGSLTRSFKTIAADIFVDKAKKTITIEKWFGSSKQNAVLRTVCSHIKNMMIGVTKGFRYKMKFVYAHFPVNVNISDVKDEIILESNNVENLGISASQIQQSTRVKNKDIRKFLDGIYVSEKGLCVEED